MQFYLVMSLLIRIFAEVIGNTRVTKKKDFTGHHRPMIILLSSAAIFVSGR